MSNGTNTNGTLVGGYNQASFLLQQQLLAQQTQSNFIQLSAGVPHVYYQAAMYQHAQSQTVQQMQSVQHQGKTVISPSVNQTPAFVAQSR